VGREPHCSKGEREKIIELKKCFANAEKNLPLHPGGRRITNSMARNESGYHSKGF